MQIAALLILARLDLDTLFIQLTLAIPALAIALFFVFIWAELHLEETEAPALLPHRNLLATPRLLPYLGSAAVHNVTFALGSNTALYGMPLSIFTDDLRNESNLAPTYLAPCSSQVAPAAATKPQPTIKKKSPARIAKEVGMGNPAEKTIRSKPQMLMLPAESTVNKKVLHSPSLNPNKDSPHC